MKTIRRRIFCILALALASIIALLPRNVTQRGYVPDTGRMRDTVVRRVPIKLGLDLRGGVHLALEVDRSKQPTVDCVDAIRRAERVVRTRIDEFGTSEPVVQIAGGCRLIVELPGITDPARAKAIVQRTAFLEFRLTDSKDEFRRAVPAIDAALTRGGVSSFSAPLSSLFLPGQVPGEMLVPEGKVSQVQQTLARPNVKRLLPRGLELLWSAQSLPGERETYRALYAVSVLPIITGEELQMAAAGRDPMTNATEVRFELTRTGGRRFAEVTSRNVGRHLAIVLDGRVQGQPAVITTSIGTSDDDAGDHPRSVDDRFSSTLTVRGTARDVPACQALRAEGRAEL